MLVRFGGHALALMASGITSPAQQAASSAGMTTQTPEGSAGELKSLEHAPPTWSNAYKFDYNTRVRAKGFQEMSSTATAIKQQEIYGDPTRKAGFDTAGQKAEVGAYGEADRKAQSLGQNIETTLGGQQADRAFAGRYMDGNMEKFGAWQKAGMPVDEKMAKKLQQDGFDVSKDMKLTQKDLSYSPKTGKVQNLTAYRQDGKESISYRDGMKTINTASGGIITQTIAGPDGNNIMTTQRGVLNTNTEAGRALAQEMKSQYRYANVFEGQRFEITRGADGQISTALFQSGAGSRDVDTFTRETGWLKSHTAKEKVDTRSEYSSGVQITAGTGISGTNDVTTYDASKLTLITRIGTGDRGVVQPLIKGSPTNQKENIETFSGQWAKELQTWGSRDGQKFDEASAGASIEMGLKAVGIGGGIDATARTGSRDISTYNIMAGSMQTVIENARTTAKSRHLTEEQAIFQDVRTFQEAVKNDFLKTKPVLDPNKHQPRVPQDQKGSMPYNAEWGGDL
jgi:hypothetical protein